MVRLWGGNRFGLEELIDLIGNFLFGYGKGMFVNFFKF